MESLASRASSLCFHDNLNLPGTGTVLYLRTCLVHEYVCMYAVYTSGTVALPVQYTKRAGARGGYPVPGTIVPSHHRRLAMHLSILRDGSAPLYSYTCCLLQPVRTGTIIFFSSALIFILIMIYARNF